MELKIHLTRGEVLSILPIEPIYEMCYSDSNWKTFSCKRRLNEFFESDPSFGWEILDEAVKKSVFLHYYFTHNYKIQMDLDKWTRLKVIIPWAANVIRYGITGE